MKKMYIGETPKVIVVFVTLLVFSLVCYAPKANAQCVSLTTLGSASTQAFNTLSNTAGSTTNNLTITGWFMTESGSGARDNEQYAVDDGGSTTGDTYSYGAAGNTDRALGGLQSGTLIPTIGVCFTNNTGATISSLDIAYFGEQWRIANTGTARDDRMDFQYSLNSISLTTGTWVDVNALDFTNPIKTAVSASALNGNNAANRTAISSSITGLSIANGATFWIRWNDLNASGADDGLAVDDFSLTPQSAPVLPNLSIDNVSLNEGIAGTTSFTFTVSLSAPAGPGGVTFDIATADGTATTADNDYTAKSLTGQTIPAGSDSYSFTVLVNGDMTAESNEDFFVNVTNVTGANVTDGQGQGTIQNDDLVCSITAISVSNISTCNNQNTYPTTDDTYTADVTVTFSTAPGSGTLDISGDGSASIAVGSLNSATSHTFVGVTLPADGGAIALTATFSADNACTFTNSNAGMAPFNCPPSCSDGIQNGTETGVDCGGPCQPCVSPTGDLDVFKFRDINKNGMFNGPGGETPVEGWQIKVFAEGADTDNDAPLYMGMTDMTGHVLFAGIPQGNYIVCEEVRSHWTITSGTVCRTISVGAGTTNVEFANFENRTYTFRKVSTPATNAAVYFDWTLQDINGGNLGDLTVISDGNATVISGGPNLFTITEIVPTGMKLVQVVCNGEDMMIINDGITFDTRPAETDVDCTFYNEPLPSCSDGIQNGDETGVDCGGTCPPCAAVNLSIDDVSLNEGIAGTTSFTFTVSLSAPAGPGGVTFDIATADGTATTADNDYTAKSLTGQTIPAGSDSYSFTVLVNGDMTAESNEDFFVNVTNVTGANVTDGQGQGTIQNDDCPTVTITATETQNPGVATNDGIICAGSTVTLATSGGGTYLWSTGSTDPSIMVAPDMTTNYSVTVTNGACEGMASIEITVNPLPAVFTVTGGGVDCSGAGVEVGLSDSELGTTYFLYRNNLYVNQFPGTGNALSLGVYTAAGTYDVVASDDITNCFVEMTGEAVVSVASPASTTTTITSDLNPSFTGDNVIFTATVISSGNPVTTGTVTFTEGATVLAANVALNGSGQATFPTNALTEGSHSITATYNGVSCFLTSNGSINQVVNNMTVVNGNSFCNEGTITLADGNTSGITGTPATPYPSNIFVSGLSGTIQAITVDLKGLTHNRASDIDLLLVAPTGETFLLMTGVGQFGTFSNTNLTLSDAAASALPKIGGVPSGTYRPASYDELTNMFPAPAPAGPYNEPATQGAATFASVFNGLDPNGTWSLYATDDTTNITGSINEGWCLNIISAAPCDITSVSFGNVGTCNNNGSPFDPSDDYYTADVTVEFVNAPLAGTLRFEPGNDQLEGGGATSVSVVGLTSPYTFTGVRFKADGTPTVVEIEFSDMATTCVQTAVGPTVGSCEVVCDITSVSFENVGTCNNNGSPFDPSDDYYTADVTVEFENAPLAGTLRFEPGNDQLEGGGATSVSVVGLTSPYTFTGVRFKADGTSTVVEIEFSDMATTCVQTAVGPTVGSCEVVCDITSVSFGNVGTCNNNDTPDPSDDYYTADVTVEFVNAPLAGTLRFEPGNDQLEGGGATSVSVVGLTSPYTFTGVRFKADGTPTVIEIEFSDMATTCVQTAVGPTVSSCPCNINIDGATIDGNVEASTVCSEEAFTLTADGATSTGLADGDKIDWYYDSDFNFTPGSEGTLLGSSMVMATPVNLTRNTCTDIAAGEIAFVSFQSDDPDIFSFVVLADLAAGVVINFTDNGWLSSGAFRTGEGVITWTAPVGGLPVGTVVTISANGGIMASVGSVSTSGSPSLSTAGDQIISFCGTLASPTKLLSGIQFGGANWDATAADANTSALPTGLTNGTTAVAVGNVDDGRFNCTGGTVSGTATAIATSINTAANWTTSATILNPAVATCTYTVTGATVLTITELETSIDDCGTFFIKGIVNPLPTSCTAEQASTSTLQVTLLCPTAMLSGDATICEGDSATVTISITDAPANQNVSGNITNGTIDIPFSGMTDGSGLATIQIMGLTQEGSYSIETILIGAACTSTTVSGTATITVNQPPVVTIGNQEPVVCATRRLLLSVLQATITLNGQPFTGTWDVLEADSDGSFRDANDAVNNVFGMAVSFVPGAVDIERGYVTLILRSDDPEGPCSAVEASVRLMILRVNCGEFPWNGQ